MAGWPPARWAIQARFRESLSGPKKEPPPSDDEQNTLPARAKTSVLKNCGKGKKFPFHLIDPAKYRLYSFLKSLWRHFYRKARLSAGNTYCALIARF
jgi:hypothetical protein